MRNKSIILSLLAALLLTACTGGSDDASDDDTEVQGLTLERDEVGDGPDPREEDDATSEPDAPDAEGEDDEAGDDQAGTRAEVSGDEVDADDRPASSEAASSAGESGSSPSDAEGPAASGSAPATSPPSTSETSPRREPAAERPTPVDLADGYGEGGLSWSVDEARWIELSSQVLEPGVPFVEAGLVAVDDPEGTAEERRARCEVALRAPQERGLRAQGELEVRLVVEGVDGERRDLIRQILDLDVELEAGEELAVEPTEGARTVRRDEVRRVACDVGYEPA